MEKQLIKTQLHGWHLYHGAKMVEFHNYEMPLWYSTGAKKEHISVIRSAGLFDTSHMAILVIYGIDSFDFLQHCFTRDLNHCIEKEKVAIKPYNCIYGAFLNDHGEVIDDAIVYYLQKNSFMIVLNSGMADRITRHLNLYRKSKNVKIIDIAHYIGKIDLQGHESARILMKVLDKSCPLDENLKYHEFRGDFDKSFKLTDTMHLIDGIPILFSRTGYTGEFGFEIFVHQSDLLKVWEKILNAGQDYGLIPCGLAARDSLRVGALLPLSTQDIGDGTFDNNPWTFILPYNSNSATFSKKFVGHNALLNKTNTNYTYPFVGYDLRKVSIDDPALVIDSYGNVIGKALTCVSDMSIGRSNNRIFCISSSDRPENFKPEGLSCGFIKVNSKYTPGQIVEIKDNRRRIKVMIVDDIRPDRSAHHSIRDMM